MTDTTTHDPSATDTETPPEQAQDATPSARPAREAAKYRTQLRATEAERDTLAAQLEAARAAELTRHIADGLHVPLDTRNQSLSAQIARAEREGNLDEAKQLRQIQPGIQVSPNDDLQSVTLRHPDDLFTIGGLDRATCFNDDGTINGDAIREAAHQLHQSRPELFTSRPAPVPGIGDVPDMPAGDITDWQQALSATQ